MTLAAYCCWVISPRYFYHIYNRWGSQTTERGKQSLPLWEDSHFLHCKVQKHKAKLCYYFSTQLKYWHLLCWILFFPRGWMHGGGVGWGQEDREEKAQGKPCTNLNQHRTNCHSQKSFLIDLGMHRSWRRNAFYYKWTQHTWIKIYKNCRLRYYYQDCQKYLRNLVFHIWGFLFSLCLCICTHLP